MDFSSCQFTEAGRKPPPKRAENQDRVLCRLLPVGESNGLLMAVADGITNCPSGGSVANWVVMRHLAVDSIDFPGNQSPTESLGDYLKNLQLRFIDEFSAPEYEGMLASGATLSVALLHDHKADCFWAGDSPIYHSRPLGKAYETQLLTRPDHEQDGSLSNCFGSHSSFSLRHCHVGLNVGDILTVTSDGIQVDVFSVSQIYMTHGFGNDALREMLRLSKQNRRFWDDLSVTAALVEDP